MRGELASRNRLLPPRWGDLALEDRVGDVAGWLQSTLRREVPVGGEDVLLARKRGRGGRPLTLLGLTERLVYRACVSIVAGHVEAIDRSREAYDRFLHSPLQHDDCEYVFKTDIAAYYQYIDHERLIDEVVAQTGDDLAVSAAVELLQQATGRSFALPQLSSVSDTLAEIYIDPMRRRLGRARFRVTRFADDFRIACRAYMEALEVWEAADGAARDLGLVLNDSKTGTPGRERYQKSLTAVEDREREVFEQLDVESFDDIGDYEDLPVEAGVEFATTLSDEPDFDEGEISEGNGSDGPDEISDSQVLAARSIVNLWLREEEEDEVQRQESAHVTSVLLQRALRVLAGARDLSALSHIPAMLVYESSLTPTITMYLRQCARADRQAALGVLKRICESGIVSPWQAAWIAYVAGDLPRRPGGERLSHVQWLQAQVRSEHPALAAEAILALARRHLTTPTLIDEVLRQLPPAHWPTAVMAFGALGDQSVRPQVADSIVDEWRFDWALDHLS